MDMFLSSRTVKELTKLRIHYKLPNLNKKQKAILVQAVNDYLTNNNIGISTVADIITEKPKELRGLEVLSRDELRARYKELGLKGKLNVLSKRELIEAITTHVTDGPLEQEQEPDMFKELKIVLNDLLKKGVSKNKIKKILNEM